MLLLIVASLLIPSLMGPGATALRTTSGLTAPSLAHHSVVPLGLGRADSPRPLSAASSAPLGVSDSGGGPGGSYATLGLFGRVTITSLSTYNASLGGSSVSEASLQLNAFLAFSSNGSFFDYWLQTVMELDTSTHAAYFEDNIWNATSAGSSSLPAGTLGGNGGVTSSSSGDYYAWIASRALPGSAPVLSYPATVTLGLNSTTDSLGRPVASFWYEDGFGPTVFDRVTFLFGGGTQRFAGFDVSPSRLALSCPRCVDDAEFVLGGPFSGYETRLVGTTSVRFLLERWVGSNYASVPDANGYGLATAEGLENGAVVPVTAYGPVPTGLLTDTNLSLNPLWSAGELARLSFSVLTTPPSGTWTVNGTSGGFANGAVDLLLWPGEYTVSLIVGSGSYGFTGVVVGQGQWLTLEVGAVPVVFVPQGLPNGTVWGVTLDNTTLHGTGAITFGARNGTHPFGIPSVPGYSVSPSSGTVNVTGSPVYVNANWSANPPSTLQQIGEVLRLPLGPVPLYVVLVLFGVLTGLTAYLGRNRKRRRVRPPTGPDLDTWQP